MASRCRRVTRGFQVLRHSAADTEADCPRAGAGHRKIAGTVHRNVEWARACPAERNAIRHPNCRLRTTPASSKKNLYSFPGSAWECTELQALPGLTRLGEAEPRNHCVPRPSLGTRRQNLARCLHGDYSATST